MALTPLPTGKRHKRPELTMAVVFNSPSAAEFDCPHCGRHQVVTPLYGNCGALTLSIYQCMSCSDLMIWGFRQDRDGLTNNFLSVPLRLYPNGPSRRKPKEHLYCTHEVTEAYAEACGLLQVHAGAAGAYARRSLELLLDALGYAAPTLLASIKLVHGEDDVDKRLPRRLRDRLDYIKEIGNFALHVRRDDELAIVSITKDEVNTCLETIEELIEFTFEAPTRHYLETLELNKKLAATNKKELPLPPLPSGVVIPPATTKTAEPDTAA